MNLGSVGSRGGVCLAVSVWLSLWALSGRSCLAQANSDDDRLDAARRLVEASDKYLHHSRLHPGMKGYGLTVMSGTEVVRFDVEIISVMTRWGPHQDVILARLSKQDLEKTGVIAGMSGSPCYFRHDGRDKLIGAVAFGWPAGKEPLCGIQPITQMLAAAGAHLASEPQEPTSQPATGPASQPATQEAAVQVVGALTPADFIAAVLDPQKRDFSQLAVPAGLRTPRATEASAFLPLVTPLMISGAGTRAIDLLSQLVRPAGIMPIQAGGAPHPLSANQAEPTTGGDAKAEKAELVAGGGIAVQLVAGDADFNAVGTVTDIVDGRVLAFGHSFFADGEVALPMGPAYVHTVVPGLITSFKLSSGLAITGTLNRDEVVGVVGRIGPVPEMIPMTIEVAWPDSPDRPAHKQSYSYRLVRHRWLTPLFAAILAQDAVWQWHNPPELHTVRHTVAIDFGSLGSYQADNVTVGRDILSAVSDTTRPLVAMLNNPLGDPPVVKRIAVKILIERGARQAEIVKLSLDGRVYRPGETVTGKLVVRPFRKQREEMAIRLALPKDLPDGTYRITACDSLRAVGSLQQEKPHQFEPRTVEQLLASIDRVVRPRADRLYLRMPLERGGLALGQRELPDLPESRKMILSQADKADSKSFAHALVEEVASPYVLTGEAQAELEVQAEPTQTLIRRHEE